MWVKNLSVLLLVVVFSCEEGAFVKAADYEMKIAEKPGRVRLRDVPYFRVLRDNKDHRYNVIRGRRPKTIVEDHNEDKDEVDPATTQRRKRSDVYTPDKEFDQKEICKHYRSKGYVPVFCKSQRMGRKLDGVDPETNEVETAKQETRNIFFPYFIIASPGYVPFHRVTHQSSTSPSTLLTPPVITERPGDFGNLEIEMSSPHKPIAPEVGEKPSADEPEPQPVADGQPLENLSNYYYQYQTPNFQLPSTWSPHQSQLSPEHLPQALHQATLVQPAQIQSQMPAYLYSNQNPNYIPYGSILPHSRKKPSIGTVVGGAFAAGAGLAIASHFLNRPRPQGYQQYYVPTTYPTHYSSPRPYPGYTYSSSYGRPYGRNEDLGLPESVPAVANLEKNDGGKMLNERVKRDHDDDHKVSKKKTNTKKNTGDKNKGPSKGTQIAGLVLGAAAGNFVANHFLNKPSGGGFLGGTLYHQGYGGYPQPAYQYSPSYTPAHNYPSYPQSFPPTSYAQSPFSQTSYPYSQSFPQTSFTQTSFPSYSSSYYPHVARQTEIRQPLVLVSTQTGPGYKPFAPSHQQPLKSGSYYVDPYFFYPTTGALTVARG